MYKTIINPKTGDKLNIFKGKGRELLKQYIKQFHLGGSTETSDNLTLLLEMGYPQEMAKKALELSGDNLDLAIDLILSGDLNKKETKEEEPLETEIKIDDIDEFVENLPIITIEDFVERDLPNNIRYKNQDVIQKSIADKFGREDLKWKDEIGDGNCMFRAISRQFFKADPQMPWNVYIENGGKRMDISEKGWFEVDMPLHAVVRNLSVDLLEDYDDTQKMMLGIEDGQIDSWRLWKCDIDGCLDSESWGDFQPRMAFEKEYLKGGEIFCYYLNCRKATGTKKMRKQQLLDKLAEEVEEMPEKITVKQLNKLLLNLIGCDLVPDYLTADKSREPDFNKDIVIIFHYQNEFNYKAGEGIHYSSILKQDIPDYEVDQYKKDDKESEDEESEDEDDDLDSDYFTEE